MEGGISYLVFAFASEPESFGRPMKTKSAYSPYKSSESMFVVSKNLPSESQSYIEQDVHVDSLMCHLQVECDAKYDYMANWQWK